MPIRTAAEILVERNDTPETYVRNGVRKRLKGGASAKARGYGRDGEDGAERSGAASEPRVFETWKRERSGVEATVHLGDCRAILPTLPEVKNSKLDLVFADPPFNWKRGYDEWDDHMDEGDYLTFTYDWIDLCVKGLRPGGSLWINIPDDWAAEIVCYLKRRLDRKPPALMAMQNWCAWHYRFGQNAVERFINSKVHALYFIKAGGAHTWNPQAVMEQSDRRAIYGDARTESKKDGMPAGMRVPMDVWYGQFWGRVQGNNKERRHYHDNQLPEVYLERVVRACSNEGDVVLDPFLGSGTTGVMAHALGRKFIGCEFSAQNAKNAVARMRAGPIRLGAAVGASTAIFERRVTPRTERQRTSDKQRGGGDLLSANAELPGLGF
ncbi:MAG: site-specific DNA-methyltransferase [Phycisphaerales bacterium]|nr:site-specific DNA-methyltransferase [Phycisphaerales bacterium]